LRVGRALPLSVLEAQGYDEDPLLPLQMFKPSSLSCSRICGGQRSAANEKPMRFHFPVSHQSVDGCPELGPFVQPTGKQRGQGQGMGAWDGTYWHPGNAKLTPALPPKPIDPTGTPTRTGDLRPGEQLGTLAMDVFLNQGCEGHHAAIPINPSRTKPLRRKRPTTPFLSASWGLFSHGHSARTRRSPVPHRPSREPPP
jgi:hypothetical protein